MQVNDKISKNNKFGQNLVMDYYGISLKQVFVSWQLFKF